MADYIDKVLTMFLLRINENVPALLIPSLFLYPITKTDKAFFSNCGTLREAIRKVVLARKEGKAGGLAVGDQKDIISMLVDDENYANIEDIIDDVIVMFIAGTKTVQGTTTNFIGNYTNN